MPKRSDAYDYGYRMGWAVARNCRKEISKLHAQDLPEFIGEKMEIAIKSIDRYMQTIPDWKEGFFEGAMNFIEQDR